MSGSASGRHVELQEPAELRELSHLQQLNRAFTFGTSLDEALSIIAGVAHGLMCASTVALALERNGLPLELVTWHGIDPALLDIPPLEIASRLFDGSSEPTEVARTPRAVVFQRGRAVAAGTAFVGGGRTRGALIAVRQPGRNAFLEHHLRLLDSLACSAATAMRNTDLLEAERRKTQESKALGTISKVMAGTLDLDQVLQAIGDQVLGLLPVDRCLIWLLDETGELMTTPYVGGVDPSLSEKAGKTRRVEPPDLLSVLGFTKGQTFCEDRAEVYALMHPDIVSRYNVKSVMIAPIVGRNHILGGIYVDRCRDFHHWTSRERGLLEALAEEAAVAIQATQLYHAQRVEAETSSALLQVATALGRYNKLDDVMRTVVAIAPRLMGSDHCSAWLWDSELDEFRPLQSWGLAERVIPAFQALRFKTGDSPYNREMLEKRAPVIVEDVLASGLIPRYIVDVLSIKSLLAVPLLSKGEVVGALNIIHTGSTHRFEPQEITIAQGIANLAGLAMENARLSEQAVKVEALRRLDRLKTELLANVSHELRTPLTAIKGLTGTLLQDDIQWGEESERDFLQTIASEADKLEKMVQELLDMSRMEAGTFRLHQEECDMAKVIMRVSDLLRPHIDKRPIEVRLSPRLRSAWADERRIGQVLSNLLQNAHKYSPPGLPVRVSARNHHSCVQVTVSDQGPGIPAEHIGHIFERFYRHPSHEYASDGAGLGLAICRGIVEAHGGKIWAESFAEKGTAFTFTVPTAGRRRKEPC